MRMMGVNKWAVFWFQSHGDICPAWSVHTRAHTHSARGDKEAVRVLMQ